MTTIFQKLLDHSYQMGNYIENEIANNSTDRLTWKTTPETWSVVEIIEHLNKVYDQYLENFEKAITTAPLLDEKNKYRRQRTLLGRVSIYSMRPKGNKRRFKMKTFDFFQPRIDVDQTNEVIHSFLKKKEQFNSLIVEAQTKNLHGIKIPTALGENVKFYIPECFEFILVHEERHMLQISELLETV